MNTVNSTGASPNSTIHLRQICLVAKSLDTVIDDLSTIFKISPCYIDPKVAQFGLENCLLPFASDFLEVVSPTQSDTAAERYLDRRGGDGGYMVITQASDKQQFYSVRQRALDKQVRIAYESDRENWALCQLHPRDMVAAFLEIEWDEQNDFTGNWHPAGGMKWQSKNLASHDSSSKLQQPKILGVDLQSQNPQELAQHWACVLDLPLDTSTELPRIATNNAFLQFTELQDNRGPGLAAIHIKVEDTVEVLAQARQRHCVDKNEAIHICGTRFIISC